MYRYAKKFVDSIFRAHELGEVPNVPKGVDLYLLKRKSGQIHDKAVFSIKSKGRTGAAIRAELIKESRRTVIIPRKYRRMSIFGTPLGNDDD